MQRTTRTLLLPVLLLSAAYGNAVASPLEQIPTGTADQANNPRSPRHRIIVGPDSIRVTNCAPDVRRLILPRDGEVEVKNDSGKDLTLRVDDETAIELKSGKLHSFFAAKRSDFLLTIFDGPLQLGAFDILVAKKLEIFGKVGAGLTLTTGSDFAGYTLKTDPGKLADTSDDVQRIVRSDSRTMNGTLVGQIFVAFDDEMGLNPKSSLLAKAFTLGLFDAYHHRFGLVASVATADATDPTYQLGVAWFLDREARCVFSYGVQFRQRDRLQFGLNEGDPFAGTALPTRKDWTRNFFIGLTFNLGNGS